MKYEKPEFEEIKFVNAFTFICDSGGEQQDIPGWGEDDPDDEDFGNLDPDYDDIGFND